MWPVVVTTLPTLALNQDLKRKPQIKTSLNAKPFYPKVLPSQAPPTSPLAKPKQVVRVEPMTTCPAGIDANHWTTFTVSHGPHDHGDG